MNAIVLAELCYFGTVDGQSRLLYSEKAAQALTEMCKPPHRLAIAQGRWPPMGRNPAEVQLEMVESIGRMATASRNGTVVKRSSSVPALSEEEEHAAALVLRALDYCAGRGIYIGRAIMQVHMQRASMTRATGN